MKGQNTCIEAVVFIGFLFPAGVLAQEPADKILLSPTPFDPLIELPTIPASLEADPIE